MFKLRRRDSLIPNYTVLTLYLIFALVPLFILSFNAVKSRVELANNPLGPPKTIHLENFTIAWKQGKFYITARNSAILVVCTVASVLTLAGMASYSLARLKPPGSDLFMVFVVIGSTLPIWLFMVPLFILWRKLGLINSLLGLIMIYTALNAPFAIFLLRSFMVQMPAVFEDAARVDGANSM